MDKEKVEIPDWYWESPRNEKDRDAFMKKLKIAMGISLQLEKEGKLELPELTPCVFRKPKENRENEK